MSDERKLPGPKGEVRVLHPDHSKIEGAQGWLAERLTEDHPNGPPEGVVLVVLHKDSLNYATFGKVTRADAAYVGSCLATGAVLDD